jgi:ArsR family transcriptional regulator
MKAQARFFKSLADETRLRILWLLMLSDELCVCDIMATLGISQSKASRHLRYLYHLGLVADRRQGLWMYYRLAAAPGSWQERQLQVLRETLQETPTAQELRGRLVQWLQQRDCQGPAPAAAPVC